jgi:hypothetical protein
MNFGNSPYFSASLTHPNWLFDGQEYPRIPINGITVSGSQIKYWSGSAWVLKPIKVWNGTAWVQKPLKRWNGASWVTV